LAGLGLLFVVVIVLGIISANDESTSTFSTNALGTEIPRPTSTPIPVIVVDLRDMLNTYKGNEVAAEKKWKNQVLEIEGIASDFDENYFDIVPIDSDAFQMSGARCYPSSEDINAMDNLRKGNRVVIMGKFKEVLGSLIMHIRIRDCIFKVS
jgi:hypothetical protein